MSGKINTREFSINDYDAAVELWRRVEGLEIAEGDDREGVAPISRAEPGAEPSGDRWVGSRWSRVMRS